MDSVLEKFGKFGVEFKRPDSDHVTLPADITLLSSEQLAELFTKLTAWADYIASDLVLAQIAERESLRNKNVAENRLLNSKMGSAVRGERITLVKAQVSVDEGVLALEQKYEEKYAYRKLVEMLLSNYERDLTLVSREITRRSNDQRAMRKDYGV